MLVYLFGFSAFVGLTSSIDQWVLGNHAAMLIFIPLLLGARYARSRFERETIAIDKQLIFEEKPRAEFEILDLAHWS
jgi:hypothetical protein